MLALRNPNKNVFGYTFKEFLIEQIFIIWKEKKRDRQLYPNIPINSVSNCTISEESATQGDQMSETGTLMQSKLFQCGAVFYHAPHLWYFFIKHQSKFHSYTIHRVKLSISSSQETF